MKTPVLSLFASFLLSAAGSLDPASVAVLARQAPAEFAADAMIRLAASAKLDRAARAELFREAFTRAGEARRALPLRASIVHAGGIGGFLDHAYLQNVDVLSLRLRAVEGLLPLDGAKARQLFLSIPRPEVPRVRCEDIFVYDVGRYYDALDAISKLDRRDAAKILGERLNGLTSPAQVAPVARLLQHAELKPSDLKKLADSLASSLTRMSGDDRSFTYYASSAGPAILGLIETLQSRHLPALPLAEAYRSYLVRHLSGDRCADDYLINNGPPSVNLMTGRPNDLLGYGATVFFAEKIVTPPLQPLSEQETTPHTLEGFATGLRSCEDAGCTQMNLRVRELVFSPEGQPLLEAEHNTDRWRVKLQGVLDALQAWQPAAGHVDEVFREKTWIYSNLYSMSTGESRARVAHSWLEYLKQSRAVVSDPAQWLLPVSALVGRVALDSTNAMLADELRRQDDPVIALYAQLEAVDPRPADKILPLL